MAVLFDTIQVGAVNNGKQSVIIPDSKSGSYRTIISTPDKVDEFLTERKNNEKKTNKNQMISIAGGTLLGGITGTMVKIAKDMSKFENVGAGAFIGCMAGLFAALGMAINYQYKNEKINEKFIAENLQV